jgi:hypothetical protein
MRHSALSFKKFKFSKATNRNGNITQKIDFKNLYIDHFYQFKRFIFVS